MKAVVRRIVLLAVLLTEPLPAQFSGLSSAADGSSLYFASTLRLKGAASQPRNGKIFVAAQDAVTLFRARDRTGVPGGSRPCTVAGFADYLGAETSSTGTIALSYRANSAEGCSFPANTFSTELATPSGSTLVPGVVRLSAAGRYAVAFLAATGRPFSTVDISFRDLQTGVQKPVPLPTPPFPRYIRIPYSGGRVIANDGTALLAVTNGSDQNGGYILRPGTGPQPFPVPDALPLLIDAAASTVVYQSQGIRLLDLHTLNSTLLIPADQPADGLRMSDDAHRLLFIRDGQAHVLDTATLTDRTLTNESAKITESTLSGDGKIVYAVTGRGGLLKIKVDDGTQSALIGHTPYLNPLAPGIIPGLAATLTGSGLSDSTIDGTPPLNPYLGNITMWIGERKVPMVQLTPTSVRFLVPWDIAGPVRIQAEAPGDTPFYFPEVEAVAASGFPQAGALARQDWQPTYVGPVNTGEIIHVYAIGFGAVSPEVPDGAAAPSAEPFARVIRPLACSNAEILYAGLAPGAVERIYQIDLRIGPTPGYQKFTCTLGGADPFIFLTLNVVQ